MSVLIEEVVQTVVIDGPGQSSVTVIDQGSVQSVVIEENSVHDTVTVSDESVSVVEVGIQGPAGRDGIDGVGADKTYTQTFSNTNTVNITHNLAKYPSVIVTDSANDEVEGDVTYIDINNLTVTFSAPFSGKVILN